MTIQDDKLIREVQTRVSENIISYERRCVITKDEFIACYNAWIKETENEKDCM